MSHVSADDNNDEYHIQLLVDTLRKCFDSPKARYSILQDEHTLFIEIEGLEDLEAQTITEIAEPILDELNLDFEEISLLPFKR